MFGAMAGANEANSGGRHPAVLTSDANAADRPLCVVDANCGGSHSAVPALDAAVEIGSNSKGIPRRSMRTCHHVSACAGSNQLQMAVDSHLPILLVGLLAMDTLLSEKAFS